jgi:uncharacterized membrane protein
MAEPRRSSSSRLDQPKANRREFRLSIDRETFGRLSESVARFLGSWTFIGLMTLFIGLWIGWNVLAPGGLRFDAYPLQFLTLLLSLQASYAAPLILLAQYRQADRDKIQYTEDRAMTTRLVADTEYNSRELAALRNALGESVTRDYLKGELRDMLEEILDRIDALERRGLGDPEAENSAST